MVSDVGMFRNGLRVLGDLRMHLHYVGSEHVCNEMLKAVLILIYRIYLRDVVNAALHCIHLSSFPF
jgi:hypothetical protein